MTAAASSFPASKLVAQYRRVIAYHSALRQAIVLLNSLNIHQKPKFFLPKSEGPHEMVASVADFQVTEGVVATAYLRLTEMCEEIPRILLEKRQYFIDARKQRIWNDSEVKKEMESAADMLCEGLNPEDSYIARGIARSTPDLNRDVLADLLQFFTSSSSSSSSSSQLVTGNGVVFKTAYSLESATHFKLLSETVQRGVQGIENREYLESRWTRMLGLRTPKGSARELAVMIYWLMYGLHDDADYELHIERHIQAATERWWSKAKKLYEKEDVTDFSAPAVLKELIESEIPAKEDSSKSPLFLSPETDELKLEVLNASGPLYDIMIALHKLMIAQHTVKHITAFIDDHSGSLLMLRVCDFATIELVGKLVQLL
jgi:hypothetical protein